jgi:hypothetical protein
VTWEQEYADTRAAAQAARIRQQATDPSPAPPEPVTGPTIDRLRAACGDGHAVDVEIHLAWVAKQVARVRG